MKKKKKGFTLIELLAVIAILAILVIVAVPNVVNMFKAAKQDAFVTQAQNIYKAAQQKLMSDQISSPTTGTTTYCWDGTQTAGDRTNKLDLSGNKNVYYDITVSNSDYTVSSFKVSDGSNSFNRTTAVEITDLTKGNLAGSLVTIDCAP